MNKYIGKYNKCNEEKLRKLQKSQPKDYWKLINKIGKNKKS